MEALAQGQTAVMEIECNGHYSFKGDLQMTNTKRCFYEADTGVFIGSSNNPIGDWPGKPYVEMPTDFNINAHRYNIQTSQVEPKN